MNLFYHILRFSCREELLVAISMSHSFLQLVSARIKRIFVMFSSEIHLTNLISPVW